MLSFEQFIDKYGLHCHFLEFLGIKTTVENYIRQSEIDLCTDPLPLRLMCGHFEFFFFAWSGKYLTRPKVFIHNILVISSLKY